MHIVTWKQIHDRFRYYKAVTRPGEKPKQILISTTHKKSLFSSRDVIQK